MTPILITVIIALLGFIGFLKLRIDSLKADYDAILEQAFKDHASNERMKAERDKLYFRNDKG